MKQGILGFFAGMITVLSLSAFADFDTLVLNEIRGIDQNVTTLMREVRLLREACFMP